VTTGQFLVNRYRIIQFIGSGAFGTTYLALDTRRPGNPTCVVKQLLPSPKMGKNLKVAQRRFTREAQILEKLGKHSQIPQLFAYFEENKQFYLVEEYIPGYPLSSELTVGWKWNEEKTINLITELLYVLGFIHSHGVIHRDIKPGNIIRRQSDGKLILIDFGAVKEINEADPGSQTRTMATGTPAYMPLEQFQGNPKPNSDIYAVGMIAIQALTGVHPRELPVIKNIDCLDSGYLYWQKMVKLRPELAKIIDKMILDDYHLRYQSSTEVIQDLQGIQSPISPMQIPMPSDEYDLATDDCTLQEKTDLIADSEYSMIENHQSNPGSWLNRFWQTIILLSQTNRAISGKVFLTLVGCLVVIGLWVFWETKIKLNAKKLYNQAVEKSQKGDNQAALNDLNKAINLVPSYEPAYYSRGIIRFRLGDYSGAIADYSQVIKLNPEDAGAYVNRCSSYRKLSDFSAAIADCSDAIKLNPNYADAYVNRCLAWISLGDTIQALPDCNQAIKLAPNSAEAYYGQGLTYSALGDPPSAIASFTEAIDRNPDLAAAYYYRGLARVELNHQNNAIGDLQKAAELCNLSGMNCEFDPNAELEKLQSSND
jgi:serine/threonine protein kinase